MYFDGWYRFLMLFLALVIFVCSVILYSGLEKRRQKEDGYIALIVISSLAIFAYIIMVIVDFVKESNKDTRTDREKLRAQNRAVINSPVRQKNISIYADVRS